MKPKLRIVLVGVLFLLLSLLEHCSGPLWWDCNPPYTLCCVAVCALFAGEKIASVFGLCVGLFADAMTADVFGLRGVLYLFFGYMIAFFAEKVLSRNVFAGTLTGIVTALLCEFALFGVTCLSRPVPFSVAGPYVLLPRFVMSFPVTLLLYGVFWLMYRERDVYPTSRRRR